MTFEDEELEDMFYGDIPNQKELEIVLNKILINIAEVRKIPFEKKYQDFYG